VFRRLSSCHPVHVTAAALALGAVLASMPATAGARSIGVTQSASMHMVRRSGTTIWERGTATGTLPGSVTARLQASLFKITGSVTFFPRAGGSLTFAVDASARSAATRARFAGVMRVTSGSGRFIHASGTFGLAGIVNRRSWTATVNAGGRLHY
jgi:hypothetical protein